MTWCFAVCFLFLPRVITIVWKSQDKKGSRKKWSCDSKPELQSKSHREGPLSQRVDIPAKVIFTARSQQERKIILSLIIITCMHRHRHLRHIRAPQTQREGDTTTAILIIMIMRSRVLIVVTHLNPQGTVHPVLQTAMNRTSPSNSVHLPILLQNRHRT
jgi:hypothetical protein